MNAAKKSMKTSGTTSKKVSAQKKKTTGGAKKDDHVLAGVIEDDQQNVSKEEVLVTQAGLKSLKEELDYLKNVRRKEVAKRLKEAISYGDLSENSEYEEAKNEQAFVEGRILELERKVKHAKIISKRVAQVVKIGSQVKIRELKTNELEEYTIVGSTEADPAAARISNESPIGSALLGTKKGDTVVVEAPGGKFEYRVVSLK